MKVHFHTVAVTIKDQKSETAYGQYFDKRHGVRTLSNLQPGDLVLVKLDQQKGWKMPAWKIIAKIPGLSLLLSCVI